MKPVLFKIGSLSVYTHGFFLVIAMILTCICLYYLAKLKKRNTEAVFDLSVFSLLAGIVAARVTYFIVYRDQFDNFFHIFRIWEGGLVSWGGFLVGVLAFILILRQYKEPIAIWLDMLGISAMLGISVGRVGSFLSGELAGRETSLPWAIRGLHPVTIYEALLLFLLFLISIILYRKNKVKKDGDFFILILIVYSLVRFGLDFVRSDPAVWLGLTITQIVSALVIIAAILFLAVGARISKKGNHHARRRTN